VGPPCTAYDEGLHETFTRQATARREAPALIFDGRVTTYAALNAKADAWAAELASAGAGVGDRVAIMLPRSPELIEALLAVLKLGGVYALLDGRWPARLLDEIIQDLGATLLVTGDGGHAGVRAVKAPAGTPPRPRNGFRPATTRGTDGCCVFLTSGTTGRPKAVISTHRATARLFEPGSWGRFGPQTVIPLAAPVSWDAFSLELWAALLNGGASLIIQEPYLSAESLRKGADDHGVNTAWLTSSLFNMIVDEDLAAFAGLRQVMIGGERLSPAHVSRFLRRHPGITLINGYGPVESTVFATTHRITLDDCEDPEGVPLGRPIAGTAVGVLDGDRLCELGEVGEICIAGEGLALGYVADSATTAAKFTEVPTDGVNMRVYRTGDLGRWGTDGLLRFHGRGDRQVKIRGHRIEPAEVERQAERALPAIQACHALVRRDPTGAARDLILFCVPKAAGDHLDDAMDRLNGALAAHHRPAAVVALDAFPLTAQGKLDERALLAAVPAGDRSTAGPGDMWSGTSSGTMRLVADVFCSVLARRDVPLDASFFELGGASLDAGRVCARLATRLGRAVPLSRFYAKPTVTGLANWLEDTAQAPFAPGRTIEGAGVPLLPMQIVYLTRQLVDPSDLTVYCLLSWVIDGELSLVALESALADVHQRHESLRAAYVPDPRPLAMVTDVPPPPLEVLPAELSVEAALSALRAELTRGLDLTLGLVWKAALVPVGTPRQAVFGCAVHHIAFDGWSESVLTADLAAAYSTAAVPVAPPRPRPPSMAGAYAAYISARSLTDLSAQRESLAADLADVPVIRWPEGAHGPGITGRFCADIAPAVVAGLDAAAGAAGVSRFMLLLSEWAACLAEVTGHRDIAVGVPVAQREGPDSEFLIGCHINMVCIRLRGAALDGGLAGVQETGRIVKRAFAAQDVPFPELLQILRTKGTGRPPLFQTMFALQDNHGAQLRLDGLRTRFVRQPYPDLPLELHTEIWPTEDRGLQVEISFRHDAVASATAHRLATSYAQSLRRMNAWTWL
jgi:amino acid adenylation domain-containing protein